MATHTRKKITTSLLASMAQEKKKAVLLTAYDFPMARFADAAGVDVLIVGDSGGMAMLGHETTMSVTMEEMLVLAAAVCRAKPKAFVVGDMPFLSYQVSDEEAVRNAGRFMQLGCDAVKCEGGVRMAGRVKAMTDAGIPVMGHIGLTPQSASQLGGYRVQGRTLESYRSLVADAKALAEAGAFSLLLEAIPEAVAAQVAAQVGMPCYGIGAGKELDGQLVIVHDMLGMFVGQVAPRFVKPYEQVGERITGAIAAYVKDVRAKRFPG
ncbi:MAG: 3-methyl-2-oxobutanoate hydroxymethyltransferase, partial [Proteobacteria bacterium]|nr:3-methyl-2-oxobutanoate hydroxymethyltransferase [Pseudomonadota bacterium]